MERIPVQSSNLASIGWENSILEVEFRNGSIYQYSGVPQEVYEDLMNAGSKGSYFHHNIKKGGYPYTRIA